MTAWVNGGTCLGPCGQTRDAGHFSRQREPFGLDMWCDDCWFAQRRIAWNIYNRARREGFLFPELACSRCENLTAKIVGHHIDYLQPLKVVWLCGRCHAKAHREERKRHAIV